MKRWVIPIPLPVALLILMMIKEGATLIWLIKYYSRDVDPHHLTWLVPVRAAAQHQHAA